jgi:hypothetical protein
LGPAGTPGDPVALLRAVETIEAYCLQVLDFEAELARIEPPELFQAAHRSFKGIGSAAVGTFEQLAGKWSSAVRELESGSRQFNVDVMLRLPQIEQASVEIAKASRQIGP